VKTSTQLLPLLSILSLPLVSAAPAAPPTPAELLAKYDAIMGPPSYEAVARMTAHRDDDTERTYKMRILKSGTERFRAWFLEPASVRGQEMLRQGDNFWLYMPNLKRGVRMASRDSFQGGDFNNADVLRVNYAADYDGTVGEDAAMPATWLLELKAKTPEAAYDRIRLWIGRADLMPVKGEYYTESGKLLRTAEFSEVKTFKGLKRPTKVLMRNQLAVKRWSVMIVDELDPKVNPPASRFVVDDLGR